MRENRGGRLYSLVYGQLRAAGIDAIEKKPLFHFFPGSTSYSLATYGCNFSCPFCQNHSLSHPERRLIDSAADEVPPPQIVAEAKASGCRSVSYTYSEPTVFLEYALEIAALAKGEGLANLLVTNGYFTPEAIAEIAKLIDAANVDLKCFNGARHQAMTGGDLEGVKDSIVRLHRAGVWVEVTTLLVPGFNDEPQEIAALAAWLAALSPDIPWHVSRYHPDWKYRDQQPTPLPALLRAAESGKAAGLRHVYLGNIHAPQWENTYCPQCRALLIERRGFAILQNHLSRGRCLQCRAAIAGRW